MLKDDVAADIDEIFMDSEDFAEEHNIDGKSLLVILENETYKERSKRQSSSYEGFYGEVCILHVRESELGYMPVQGQRIVLDGKYFMVESCSNHCGILEISLIRNATWLV